MPARPGGPSDRPELVAPFAEAARIGGAKALRIEGEADLRAVRAAIGLPIVGLVKRSVEGSDVFITPEARDVDAVAACGAQVIAFDATDRDRPVAVADLIRLIHDRGRLAMADVATHAEGVTAFEPGAGLVATTLSGYTAGTTGRERPDLDLIRSLAGAGVRVVAEGNLRTPEQARRAREEGAFAVTVGSAITRPEHIASWFARAIESAG